VVSICSKKTYKVTNRLERRRF